MVYIKLITVTAFLLIISGWLLYLTKLFSSVGVLLVGIGFGIVCLEVMIPLCYLVVVWLINWLAEKTTPAGSTQKNVNSEDSLSSHNRKMIKAVIGGLILSGFCGFISALCFISYYSR